MRRRNRSGGRIMIRGKPGLILLVILLVVGVFIAYYTLYGSSSSSSKSTSSRSKFEKYRSKGRGLPLNNLNVGLRYGGQMKAGPQMQDPPSFENRLLQDKNKFGGINMKPLEPPQGFDGPRKDVDEDYQFKDDDDLDEKDDLPNKEKEEEDKSKTSKEERKDTDSKFKQTDENVNTGILYPQLYVSPDPKTVEQFQQMEHLVHLDLKGAPPKIDYMISLLPMMRKLGATGLLVEYEDMFPYHDELRILASESPYSTTDILRLLNAAKVHNFKVIPLIQTFGHMEFVLKYAQYQELRENFQTPQVINPASTRSYDLIGKMIDQVMTLHPDAPYIHIGCDEVYGLGEGKSRDLMIAKNKTKEQIFLDHVIQVAGSVKKKYPKTNVMMWDDELRHKISSADIEKSGLGNLVELMVWSYTPDPKVSLRDEIWVKYGKYFSGIWAASSFKGATGSAQYFTNVSHHLENHINWVQIVKEIKDVVPKEKFRGFALTGWQRYDHFAALCELLPSSIPSLAVNLQAVYNGGFTPEIHKTVSRILNCTKLVDIDFPKKGTDYIVSHDCKFPGSDFYYAVQALWVVEEKFRNDKGLQSRIQGWLTDFHVRTHFSSPGHMKILQKKLARVIEKLNSLQQPVTASLMPIYDEYTVQEWIAVHLTQLIDELKGKMSKVTMLLQENTWNKRPVAGPAPGGLAQQQTQQQGGFGRGQNNFKQYQAPFQVKQPFQGLQKPLQQQQQQPGQQPQQLGQLPQQQLGQLPQQQLGQLPQQRLGQQLGQQLGQKPQQFGNGGLPFNRMNVNGLQSQPGYGQGNNQPNFLGRPHPGLNSFANNYVGNKTQGSQKFQQNFIKDSRLNYGNQFNQNSAKIMNSNPFLNKLNQFGGPSPQNQRRPLGSGADFNLKADGLSKNNFGQSGDTAKKQDVVLERSKDFDQKKVPSQDSQKNDFDLGGQSKDKLGQNLRTDEKKEMRDQQVGDFGLKENLSGEKKKPFDGEHKKDPLYDDKEDKEHAQG